MSRRSLALLLPLLATLLAGCPVERRVLRVIVRSDWLPGVEAGSLNVTVNGASPTSVGLQRGEDLFRGRDVLVGGLFGDEHRVRVEIRDLAGAPLSSREATVTAPRGEGVVEIVLPRDCRGVTCDAGQTCVDGTCGSPACTASAPERCGPAECTRDADCASGVGCAVGFCDTGVCLFAPGNTLCAAEERCDLDMGCVEVPDPSVEVRLFGEAELVAGGTTPVTFVLSGPWESGQRIGLAIEGGQIFANDLEGSLLVPGSTQLAPMEVPATIVMDFDAPVGQTVTLGVGAALVTGTVDFLVVDPPLRPVDLLGEVELQVADGFGVTIASTPADEEMYAGRLSHIAAPAAASRFFNPLIALGPDAATGAVLSVLDGVVGGVPLTATGDPLPTRELAQMIVTDRGSHQPDRLALCSREASSSALVLTGPSTAARSGDSAPCFGVAVDVRGLLGAVGAIYAQRGEELRRLELGGRETPVGTLPPPGDGGGYELYLPNEERWTGGLYLVSRSATGVGQVERVPSIAELGAPEPVLTGLDGLAPGGLVFTEGERFGVRIYAMVGQQLRAYRPDGSYTVIVAGLSEAAGIAKFFDEIWFLDRARGLVLVLS